MAHHELEKEFARWIGGDAFTCLGARAALKRNSLVVQVYQRMDSGECAAKLYSELLEFIDTQLAVNLEFSSFVAIFLEPREIDECDFEGELWRQLGLLHKIDARFHSWSSRFSSDVNSPDFAFSIAGHAFFVAGLNPGSSRISRRFSYPALVFNSHEQFGRLKAQGTYYRLQRKIRQKEVRLQGSINPMLSDHGESSEARQYSGRAVQPGWTCPFCPETPGDGEGP